MSQQTMTVGTRLALGFGLVLLLMAAVSGLGIYNMQRIHAQLEKVVQLNVAKLTHVQDMSEAVHIVARVTRTIVLLTEDAAMQRELPKLEAARAQYNQAQAALEALPATAEGKDIRARIRALQQEARPLTDQVLQLAAVEQQAASGRSNPHQQQRIVEQSSAKVRLYGAEQAQGGHGLARSLLSCGITMPAAAPSMEL